MSLELAIICPICMQRYESPSSSSSSSTSPPPSKVVPKMMPCGHSTCQVCIDTHAKRSSPPLIHCPLCRSKIDMMLTKEGSILILSADQLPTNFGLLDIVTAADEERKKKNKRKEEGDNNKQQQQHPPVRCEVGNGECLNSASHWCAKCPKKNQRLCEVHLQQHNLFLLSSQQHRPVPIAEEEKENDRRKRRRSSSSLSTSAAAALGNDDDDDEEDEEDCDPPTCEEHLNLPLTIFCKTCNRPLCDRCALLAHKDHSYREIHLEIDAQKKLLQTSIEELKQKAKRISSAVHTAKQLKEHVLFSEERFSRQLDSFVKTAFLPFVDNVQLAMKAEKHEDAVHRLEGLDEQISQWEKFLTRATTVGDSANSLVETGSKNLLFLSQKSPLDTELGQLLETSENLTLRKVSYRAENANCKMADALKTYEEKRSSSQGDNRVAASFEKRMMDWTQKMLQKSQMSSQSTQTENNNVNSSNGSPRNRMIIIKPCSENNNNNNNNNQHELKKPVAGRRVLSSGAAAAATAASGTPNSHPALLPSFPSLTSFTSLLGWTSSNLIAVVDMSTIAFWRNGQKISEPWKFPFFCVTESGDKLCVSLSGSVSGFDELTERPLFNTDCKNISGVAYRESTQELFLLDREKCQVKIYAVKNNSDGRIAATMGWKGLLTNPVALAVSSDYVLVLEKIRPTYRVFVFSKFGILFRNFSVREISPKMLQNGSNSLAIDKRRPRFFLADFENCCVYCYSFASQEELILEMAFQFDSHPFGIALNRDCSTLAVHLGDSHVELREI